MTEGPHFTFNAVDWLSDWRIQSLGNRGQGILITLMCHCWLEGEIQNSPKSLAKLLGERKDYIESLKPNLECFFSRGSSKEWWVHTELETQRRSTRSRNPINPRGRGVEWRRLRQRLFRRDNWTCQYCGETNEPLELDHRQPVSRGGDNRVSNLVTACKPCNRRKHNKTEKEFRLA